MNMKVVKQKTIRFVHENMAEIIIVTVITLAILRWENII